MQVPGKYVIRIYNHIHNLHRMIQQARDVQGDVDKLATIAEEVMNEAILFKANADAARRLARHDDLLNRGGSHLRV